MNHTLSYALALLNEYLVLFKERTHKNNKLLFTHKG